MKTCGHAVRELLSDLQGNILQPHRRRNAVHLMISFGTDSSRLPAIRTWFSCLASTSIRNAWTEHFEKEPKASPFCSLLLTAKGYRILGEEAPVNTAFRAGMLARGPVLNDPPAERWEMEYREGGIDAMLILADDNGVRLAYNVVADRHAAISAGCSVLALENSCQLRRHGRDIEHFGFVDGISQPEFFCDQSSDAARWSSSASLDLVLEEEPDHSGHFGSYMVFRKLEQNVASWNVSVSRVSTFSDGS